MEKMSKLMLTVDAINNSQHSSYAVKIASMGNGLEEISRKDHSSRLFTTRLEDIIEVHA